MRLKPCSQAFKKRFTTVSFHSYDLLDGIVWGVRRKLTVGAQCARIRFDLAEYILIHWLNYFVTNTIVLSISQIWFPVVGFQGLNSVIYKLPRFPHLYMFINCCMFLNSMGFKVSWKFIISYDFFFFPKTWYHPLKGFDRDLKQSKTELAISCLSERRTKVYV